jgi:hypothetical protein
MQDPGNTGRTAKQGEQLTYGAKRAAWHPAFIQAIQADLVDYLNILDFMPEFQLTAAPLRMDLLVIKKKKNVVINNPIARFFRGHNIVEYKSPKDYISTEDFLRVHAYAYQYAVLTKGIDLADVTLTFIGNKHPRKLLQYLTEEHEYKIEQTSSGVWLADNKFLPIQIIQSGMLSESAGLFLKSLTKTLRGSSMQSILEKRERLEKKVSLDAYLNVVIKENPKALLELEVKDMAKKSPTLDEVLEQLGFTQRWEERYKAQEKEKLVRNLLRENMPVEKIAELVELSLEKVKKLAEEEITAGDKHTLPEHGA